MDGKEIIISEDGSSTVMSDQFGVTYHSKYGAVEESNTVFLNAGLQYKASQGNKEINIFEMGFGTGLNALMTYDKVKVQGITINYHTVEAFPITLATKSKLNYMTLFPYPEIFDQMHGSNVNDSIMNMKISEDFIFTKHIDKLENLDLERSYFDIIYYDAFAPSAQSNLWEAPLMSKMYETLRSNGILVTYCAKGSFKRTLRALGFEVEGLPGPKGKREITRARKP